MSLFFLAILAIGAPPAAPQSAGVPTPATESSGSLDQSVQQPQPKTAAELRNTVHDALCRWARPSPNDAVPAGRAFLGLYAELRRDTQLLPPVREQLRIRVRRRLIELASQIKLQQAKEKREDAAAGPPSVQLPADRTGNLAQQGGGQGFAPGGQGAQAPADDAGQDLVEMIQAVIAPTTWDSVGGNGSIYYWRPGRALVIRQTDEVHEQIGQVLDQLERMGR